jgi:plastocyanin
MRRLAGVALILGAVVIPSTSARAQAPALVEIHNNYFSPAEIHVTAGGTATWTDVGAAHSVTSDDGVSFDSNPGCSAPGLIGCMALGDTFEHQFNVPETVTYHCRVHGDAMVGRVVVDAATTTSTTSATTSTSASSTSLSSDQPTVTQDSLPSLPGTSRGAVPKSIIRSKPEDDVRPWALTAVAIASATTVAGIVLVRRGRVPFG